MGIVAVEHGGSARFEPEKNLGLGIGDRLDRIEEFEMDGLDGGDDGDVGAYQPGERRDLARMVHADLEHAVARGDREPRERERYAPVIVERGGGGMGRTVRAKRERQRLL